MGSFCIICSVSRGPALTHHVPEAAAPGALQAKLTHLGP